MDKKTIKKNYYDKSMYSNCQGAKKDKAQSMILRYPLLFFPLIDGSFI